MNGNSSGYLIATIVMGALLFGAGLFAYTANTKAANQAKLADDRAADAEKANRTNEQLVRGVTEVKTALGYQGDNVGDFQTPDSVLGKLNADLEKFGGSERKADVAGTLQSLRGAINAEREAVADLRTVNARLQDRINELEREYQGKVNVFEEATNAAKNEMNTQETKSEEQLAQRDVEINTAKDAAKKAIADVTKLRRDFNDEREETAREIERYNQRIDYLAAEIAEKNKVSFDKPDGTVVRADPRQRLVYLDLGSRDGLTTRTTFSVYKKNNAGVGRGLEDVKGAIEIIRIIGERQSEARVLEEDIENPIGAGDFVFSPIWQAGQKNYFSFVGEIDLDNDGQDDRELLFQMIRDQGSEVELYIDEQGRRVNGATGELDEDASLTSKTKYLVLGEIPDRTTFAPSRDEYEWAVEIGDRRAELEKEANQQGILKVNLPDFQSYIGYRPSQRLFLPGNRRSAENLGR